MKNYVAPGNTLTFTAAGTISSGDVVVTQNVVGIAQEDAVSGETVELLIEGIVRLPKNTSTAITFGERVDWDNSATQVDKAITPAASDVQDFGIATETVLAAATHVNVKLQPGIGTFT